MKKIISLILSAILCLTAVAFVSCDKKSDDSVIKVAASSTPHAEILEQCKSAMAEKGFTLEIEVMSDYVIPNTSVEDGEFDANYFQHQPYLDDFVKEHPEVKLVNAGGIHIEPMGIYSKSLKDLKDVKAGATVAIPNDPTNGGRALSLLAKAGLIQLKDGVGVAATVNDVVKNEKNLKFQELEAAQVPRALEDVDLAVINSNFAMQIQLNPVKDTLFIEDASSPYVNIVSVRTGDEGRPEIQALLKALKSEKVKKFIIH